MFIDILNTEETNECYYFLLFNESIHSLKTLKLEIQSRNGIFYYVVDNEYFIIENDGNLYCSCDLMICRHLIKVKLDGSKAVYKK